MSTNTSAETRRMLKVCDICGYCNGLCPVFDAARRRPDLDAGDLAQLANLCHGCGSCLFACQYAPPHPFAINIPRALAAERQRSWQRFGWPTRLSRAFERRAMLVWLVMLGCIAGVVASAGIGAGPSALLTAQHGSGAFYRIIPLEAMLLLGALPLGWSLLAIGIGLGRFWRATSGSAGSVGRQALGQALHEILLLSHLAGGGAGCAEHDGRLSQRRRWLHQLLLAGLALCLAATAVAAGYEHLLGRQAPYPLLSPPVLLGTAGGIAMLAAVLGLGWLRRQIDPRLADAQTSHADAAVLSLLLSVTATGLALLAWRQTAAMGLLLAVHLGCVLALFLLLPYSKLVHGGYRALALVRDATERRPADRGPHRGTRMKQKTVLLLGGTTEAYDLADRLASRDDIRLVNSLAGRTSNPRLPAGETRIGGFGGIDGLIGYLQTEGIAAVIDATHPFAATMGRHAAAACECLNLPLLRLERPGWSPTADDHWIVVDDWDQAVAQLNRLGRRRVLLALGRQDLAPFAAVDGIWFLIRAVTRPEPMPTFADHELLLQRGPFDLAHERALLEGRQIDAIVCKNSGGEATSAKLDAARLLGIPVIMRRRPERPALETVTQPGEAVDWLQRRLHLRGAGRRR
jgi:citrate/tricarballylate utilization protein